jgi:hypothetical protein
MHFSDHQRICPSTTALAAPAPSIPPLAAPLSQVPPSALLAAPAMNQDLLLQLATSNLALAQLIIAQQSQQFHFPAPVPQFVFIPAPPVMAQNIALPHPPAIPKSTPPSLFKQI